MAQYHSTHHIHPFPWFHVAGAIFQRYPNPFATHVLSEDTLETRLIHQRLLYTRRLLTKTNRLPAWGERFFTSVKRYVPLVEEAFVDTENKVVTTYTRNVGLSRFMTAVERVRYTVHPDNPGETLATKEVWIESGLYGLRTAVKSFGIERFKQNCHRATHGFNHVLEELSSRQVYLNQVGHRKWSEMMTKGEEFKDRAKFAAEMAKKHSRIQAKDD